MGAHRLGNEPGGGARGFWVLAAAALLLTACLSREVDVGVLDAGYPSDGSASDARRNGGSSGSLGGQGGGAAAHDAPLAADAPPGDRVACIGADCNRRAPGEACVAGD